jgi:hypothetical protein
LIALNAFDKDSLALSKEEEEKKGKKKKKRSNPLTDVN